MKAGTNAQRRKGVENDRFNAFPLFPLLAFDQTSLNSYLELKVI